MTMGSGPVGGVTQLRASAGVGRRVCRRLSHGPVAESGPGPGMSTSAKRILGWLATPPFLAAFSLLLVLFDPVQRLALLFGPRPHEIAVGLLQSCLKQALRLCATRF